MTTDTETLPVYREPTYDERDESEAPGDQVPPVVHWDLSFGCNLSFGANEHGPLLVSVNTSDRDRADGITQREVTPAQLRAYAAMLVRLADEHEAVAR